ncbi:hypothetical protein QCA50_014694 [Cerrena zonata]|uniref:Protein kinase domain-containing protein n=1 Tax=Cerrena zonata TaxID=2478898 RepID=A0AAW0FLU2_9APHY
MTKKLQFCVCKNVRTLFNIKGVRNGTPEKALYVATCNVGPETTKLVIRRWTYTHGPSRLLRVSYMPWNIQRIVEDWQSNDHVVELRGVLTSFTTTYVMYDYVTFDLQQILYTRSRILQLQSLSIDFIKSVTYQALKGLAFLHERTIHHHKLESGSILITEDGVVKIGDIDHAWCPLEHNSIYTTSVGTARMVVMPLWNMAPEVLLQHKSIRVEVKKEADIWALGCIVLEMAYLRQNPVFQRPNHHSSPMSFLLPEDVKFVMRAMTMLLGTPELTDFNINVVPELIQILKTEDQNVSRQPSKLQDWCSKHIDNCPAAYELLCKLLTYAPWKRATACEALQDPWFQDLHAGPLPSVLDYLTMDHPSERDWATSEPRSPDFFKKQRDEGGFNATTRIEGMPRHFELPYIVNLEKELEAKKRAQRRPVQMQSPSKGVKREREDVVVSKPTSTRRNSVKKQKTLDSSSMALEA